MQTNLKQNNTLTQTSSSNKLKQSNHNIKAIIISKSNINNSKTQQNHQPQSKQVNSITYQTKTIPRTPKQASIKTKHHQYIIRKSNT